ncbi:hypothetical protein J8657_00900 [Dickeya oryzae]|uniref:Uncharacterized protein n=1 Tax=Dickeya oryzae TaxID=1240404 RepID=A0ABS5B6R3_9GAMM|nr:hypothetical protein [Dickeya oryzae]MBP2856154.1 hypothetical protein [Dickeya oryzae]
MINNPRVIVIPRSGDFAIAVTDGSDDYHDAVLMVVAGYCDNGECIADTMESTLYFAAKRIIELESKNTPPVIPANESRGVKAMTPTEFWASLRMMAETTFAQLQQLRLQEKDCQTAHQAAISSLSSLLREQA